MSLISTKSFQKKVEGRAASTNHPKKLQVTGKSQTEYFLTSTDLKRYNSERSFWGTFQG